MGGATVARMALVVLLAAGAAACNDDNGDGQAADEEEHEEGAAFVEADAESVLSYRLVDYAFEGPARARGPRVFFKADNAGTEDHELEVLNGAEEAVGEIEAFPPGGDAEPLAVELAPGTYTLQCILETDDGVAHRNLGMVSQLVVE